MEETDRFPKPMVAFRRLVIQPNYVCSLTRTCCSMTRCGLRLEHGTTTSVRRRLTLCASLAVWSPILRRTDKLLLWRELWSLAEVARVSRHCVGD